MCVLKINFVITLDIGSGEEVSLHVHPYPSTNDFNKYSFHWKLNHDLYSLLSLVEKYEEHCPITNYTLIVTINLTSQNNTKILEFMKIVYTLSIRIDTTPPKMIVFR